MAPTRLRRARSTWNISRRFLRWAWKPGRDSKGRGDIAVTGNDRIAPLLFDGLGISLIAMSLEGSVGTSTCSLGRQHRRSPSPRASADRAPRLAGSVIRAGAIASKRKPSWGWRCDGAPPPPRLRAGLSPVGHAAQTLRSFRSAKAESEVRDSSAGFISPPTDAELRLLLSGRGVGTGLKRPGIPHAEPPPNAPQFCLLRHWLCSGYFVTSTRYLRW